MEARRSIASEWMRASERSLAQNWVRAESQLASLTQSGVRPIMLAGAGICCTEDRLWRMSMAVDPHIPRLPLAGLSFRHLRGEEDAQSICAVRSGCLARDQIDPLSTLEGAPRLEQARTALAEVAVQGRHDHWLIAQINTDVVGYCRFEPWHEDDGTHVYLNLGWVLPAWRGKGIGTAMLHWVEERSRRAATADHYPHDRCEFAANASSTENEATALLVHEGYHVGYTAIELGLDSTTPLPAPAAPPPGIDVRPALPAHFLPISENIAEAYENEYAGGRFAEEYDPKVYAAGLGQPPNDPALWQIAWDGEQIAGQVMPVISNGRAEVFEVSVRPAWRRRGLARTLLLRALHGLRERGVSVIRLHTADLFPTRAIDLYQSVGFRVLKWFPRYRKPFVWT